MKTRLANKKDLPALKTMFLGIVKKMHSENVFIWNEYYPYEEFDNDIKKKQLYVVTTSGDIVAAFALVPSYQKDTSEELIYLNRLGVNATMQKSGYGKLAINEAKRIAKSLGYNELRLMVVNTNLPAIAFYEKLGFIRVGDEITEFIPETNSTLTEYCYKIELV